MKNCAARKPFNSALLYLYFYLYLMSTELIKELRRSIIKSRHWEWSERRKFLRDCDSSLFIHMLEERSLLSFFQTLPQAFLPRRQNSELYYYTFSNKNKCNVLSSHTRPTAAPYSRFSLWRQLSCGSELNSQEFLLKHNATFKDRPSQKINRSQEQTGDASRGGGAIKGIDRPACISMVYAANAQSDLPQIPPALAAGFSIQPSGLGCKKHSFFSFWMCTRTRIETTFACNGQRKYHVQNT